MLAWPDHLLTLDEWDALPGNEPHRYELVEGVLLVTPRPVPLHQRAVVRLAADFDRQLPAGLTAVSDVDVVVEAGAPTTVRAPDVVVVASERVRQNPPRFDASDVLLAVEIVSAGSGRTDRVMKFAEYAEAGIPHYWLVELGPPVTLAAYALAGDAYKRVGGGAGTVELADPAPLRLDLDRLTSR